MFNSHDWCIQGANSTLSFRGRRSLSAERDEGRLRTELRAGGVDGSGKTTEVICKLAFCLLTGKGKCKILSSHFAVRPD